MRRPLIPVLASALVASLALSAAPVFVPPAGAAVSDRVTLIGLTTDDKLETFTTDGPGTVVSTVAVTGLAAGEHLVDIGFRPATAGLYGLGTTSRLYSINRTTGAATALGGAAFAPGLSGTSFGIDFNPVVDRIRVVSESGQNLRLQPDTGTVAGTDNALNYAVGDPAGATAPHVTGAAYTNGFSGASLTALYGIDSGRNTLVLQNPPNAGVLNTVGALGVVAGDVNGFDIDVTPSGNIGLAAFTVGGVTRLYSIDLTTGKASEQAPIGDGTIAIKGLTVAPSVGYWEVSNAGTVAGYGDADPLGSPAGLTLTKPIVGIASSPSGEGFWVVASDGGIFNYGDAKFYGSTGAIKLNQPIVGIASYPDGKGYWMVASDGGIFSFAADGTPTRFYGSAGGLKLVKPIVGMAPTPTGNGYWLVASDGGIFSYGDAAFFGSTGAIKLNKPIVGMARFPDGKGYWMVASDGGIFSFRAEGTPERFYGSAGAIKLAQPIVGMATTHTGAGYWMVASDGGIFAFGDATPVGSAASRNSPSPFVGMAAV
jgi:ribosomal protein L24E